jgi:hypothetical protein
MVFIKTILTFSFYEENLFLIALRNPCYPLCHPDIRDLRGPTGSFLFPVNQLTMNSSSAGELYRGTP